MKVDRLREHAHALGFTPQDEVRWLSPRQLVLTAAKVGVSSLFAGYADRREVQAALDATALEIMPADDGLWLDYVADLGDGFDPTFTVAWLLGRRELVVDGHRLRRADVLIMGGDEVYPTPSGPNYEDRTTGPYRAALAPGDQGAGPTLLAVPGNHDWYDGLTAFLRIFTQRRPVGGWRTRQTRSYFAARLPHGWWLVGLDTQLGQYIDDPQIRYFREHLSRHLAPGDGVIVCAPSPTWVTANRDEPDAFNSLHFFERDVVEQFSEPDTGRSRPTGARVRLWISGDSHHYARYAETSHDLAGTSHDLGGTPGGQAPPGGPAPRGGPAPAGPTRAGDGLARQLITCGMGGAYLLGTEDLPESLEVPPKSSRMSARGPSSRFRRQECWPSPGQSRRWRLGALRPGSRGIVARNPGLWRLVGLTHAFGLPVLAFLLGVEQDRSPGQVLRLGAPADVLGLGAQLAAWIGAAVALACLVPLLRGDRPRRPPEWIFAALAQLAVALLALAAVLAVPWPAWGGWQVTGVAALGVFAVAGWVGCYVLAACFLVSPTRTVRELLFSAQALEEGKGFLRLHLDPGGRLTIYPVLVEQVCHDWDLVDADPVSSAGPRRARPVPASGAEPRPRLVEDPFSVVRDPCAVTGPAVTGSVVTAPVDDEPAGAVQAGAGRLVVEEVRDQAG